MSCDLEQLLVVVNEAVNAVAANGVCIRTDTGCNAVLYSNPVHVLRLVAPESRFDICDKNVELYVAGYDGATQTFSTLVEDSRKIHFYRRLLAQTALGVLGVETVCTRLIERSLARKELEMRTLISVLFPGVDCAQLDCMAKTATAEMFVRKAGPQHLAALVRRRFGTVDVGLEMESLDGCYFCTTTLTIEHQLYDTGIYSQSALRAESVTLLHLLTDAITMKKSLF
jgi:hypothetical protein